MKRKDMIRTKWTRILRKDVVIRDAALPDGRRGKAGLIAIRKVQQPLVIRYGDRSVTIADGGIPGFRLPRRGRITGSPPCLTGTGARSRSTWI
jgi:hypothetical protein